MGSIPFHPAIEEGKKGKVAPHTDVFTWVESGPPLPQDNIPGENRLAIVFLHAQPLTRAVTSILGSALPFLVCHSP